MSDNEVKKLIVYVCVKGNGLENRCSHYPRDHG